MSLGRRIMFIFTASLLLLGIWQSGWAGIHWILYVIMASFFLFGLSGICPAIIIENWKERRKNSEKVN